MPPPPRPGSKRFSRAWTVATDAELSPDAADMPMVQSSVSQEETSEKNAGSKTGSSHVDPMLTQIVHAIRRSGKESSRYSAGKNTHMQDIIDLTEDDAPSTSESTSIVDLTHSPPDNKHPANKAGGSTARLSQSGEKPRPSTEQLKNGVGHATGANAELIADGTRPKVRAVGNDVQPVRTRRRKGRSLWPNVRKFFREQEAEWLAQKIRKDRDHEED